MTGANGTIAACGSQGATASTCVTIAIQAGAAATQTSPGTFSIPIVIETLGGYTGPTTLNVTPQFTAQTVAYFAPAGSAPAAQAASEYGGQLSAANFANQTYVDVQFAPVGGGQVISGSITNGALSLGGAGAAGITGFAGGQNPIALGNGVYRFLLQGSFALGQVTVTFAANSFYSTSARGPVPGGAQHDRRLLWQSRREPELLGHRTDRRPGADGSGHERLAQHDRVARGQFDRRQRDQRPGLHRDLVHSDLRKPDRPGDDQRQRDPDHQLGRHGHPAQWRSRP